MILRIFNKYVKIDTLINPQTGQIFKTYYFSEISLFFPQETDEIILNYGYKIKLNDALIKLFNNLRLLNKIIEIYKYDIDIPDDEEKNILERIDIVIENKQYLLSVTKIARNIINLNLESSLNLVFITILKYTIEKEVYILKRKQQKKYLKYKQKYLDLKAYNLLFKEKYL